METYVILVKFTQQGIKNIKESPARNEAAKKAVEAAGGKWLGHYVTLGQYDELVIVQSPDAHTAATLLLATASLGNVSTETLRAFTAEEYEKIVAGVP